MVLLRAVELFIGVKTVNVDVGGDGGTPFVRAAVVVAHGLAAGLECGGLGRSLGLAPGRFLAELCGSGCLVRSTQGGSVVPRHPALAPGGQWFQVSVSDQTAVSSRPALAHRRARGQTPAAMNVTEPSVAQRTKPSPAVRDPD